MKRRWAPVGMGSRSKRRVTFSRSRAEADQTSLPGRLEVLGDWEVVCVIPVSKRWNLSTSLTHLHIPKQHIRWHPLDRRRKKEAEKRVSNKKGERAKSRTKERTHIHRSWWWRIKAKEKDGLLLLLVL